jgi:transposase
MRMEIKDEQWLFIEPIIQKAEPKKRTGRPQSDFRQVFEGIIWVLRTGARWKDLPKEFPSYQTCHRWFAKWVELGTLNDILWAMAKDLKDRGELDLSECLIDATFSGAKKGVYTLDLLSVAKGPRSWQLRTAMVFQSPYILRAHLRMKANWSKKPLIVDSSEDKSEDW